MGLASKMGLLNSSLSQKDDLGNSINNYQRRLGAAGYPPPAQDKDSGLSWLGKKVLTGLDYLNRPLDAAQVGLKYAGQGRSFFEGAQRGFTGKEEYRGAEMLKNLGVQNKIGRGVGGFAIDMAMDPLNAVTFGAGSFLKGALTGATMTTKGLDAAGELARENALRQARLAVQKERGATSFKQLAKTFDGADRARQADAAIKAKAFEGTTEQEFIRQARIAAQQRATRNAGKGLSVLGQSLVSGERLQNAGAKINTAVNKIPGVTAAGEALAKGFNPNFVKGLDVGEREVLRQLRSSFSGENALKDIKDADKFRNIAALQRGAKYRGKDVDRAILDIISKGGRDVTPDEWRSVIATTDRQKAAARALGLPENATLQDLVSLYTATFKGIGMAEHTEGVLAKLLDQKMPSKVELDDVGKAKAFSTYVPRVINREFDDRLRKGSMTRNFNVRNEFNQLRNKNYEGKSITEINEMIAAKAAERGDMVGATTDFLETSALNALMSRQLTSNKVLSDKHTVDAVLKTFGKRITGQGEVRKAMYDGYDIVVPNASVNLFTVGRLPKNAGSEELNLGLETVNKGTTRGIKNLLENNGNVLQKISEQDAASFIGNINLTMYALPKGIAEKFNRQAKLQIDDGVASIGKLVDKFYSVWKPLVTGLRPQYHARNLVSSGFNNFLDLGTKMFEPDTQRAAALIASAGGGAARNAKIKIGEKTYTARELHELMVGSNALNTFFLTDTNSLSKGLAEDIARNNTGSKVGRVLGKPAELGRATGNRVEEYSRAVNFVAHLKQGFSPEEAADISRKYHFDYQELTEFEQSIKRAMPFYTWARKNIPLQLESLLNNPTPYLALSRAQETGAEMTGTDIQNLPDYARRDFAVPFGKSKDGRTKVFSAGMPAGDLFYNWKDLAGSLNPLIKVPLEMYTGQNFLTQGALNSYPEETAVMLGEGNSLVAKGLQNMPWLQAQLEARPAAATVFQRILGSAGVVNDINRYALPPQSMGGTLQGSRDANNTGGIAGFTQRMVDPNFVKYFDEKKGAQSRDFEYQRKLSNIVQMLKAKGMDIPDVRDLERKRKLY